MLGRKHKFWVASAVVKSSLPTTGTPELLDLLSPYVPDEFINDQWPLRSTGGRRQSFSAAQLWRTHLLALLTPAHSLNLVKQLLHSQRDWRRFAHLRHHERVPDVRMLHDFRARVGVEGLRRINARLLESLIPSARLRQDTIALIDATDLPAACAGFKKKHGNLQRPPSRTGGPDSQDRTKPLVCRV